MNCNIGETLIHRAMLTPDDEGFVGDGYRYTFKEVNSRVNGFASYLKRQNVAPGERLAILCKNNEHLATAIYAAGKIGAIAVVLNWRLQGPELNYILNNCGASILLYDNEFQEAVAQLRASIPVRSYIRWGGDGADPEFESALSGQPSSEPELVGGGDDPAIIMYTSGTTGKPKGAVLTHNNLLWSTFGLSHTLDWNYRDRFLLVAPLFHIGGLAPLVTNVHKGVTTVFMPNFEPVAAWATIAEERITTMMSVPLMLQAMLMVAKAKQVNADSLRWFMCGASAVPESLIRAYLALGIKVQQVYGITEFSGGVTFWLQNMPLEKCNTQGKPIFYAQLKVADPETGRELPIGEVGEILCKGPVVFKGYWDNPEATKGSLIDGWYRSGDLGKVDEDGYFRVVDRLKDMIISGGENIYPAELEAVIMTHPFVAEAAVVGLPDPKWGEIPVAFVVKKAESQIDANEIVSLCKEKLASYKCVKDVRFIDALPKNPVGKILKTSLRGR
ncbi:MAG: long-chain fatty acid--CoA ligase [Desulfomonile tiedjei]|uniref:Long-chain fatty acid--CoA ligase n=1 Tax=Desulfomonile tiedjei TaxID=2358 RepID=A0A9D6V0X3_9BACT|nr:long-chain fatty acid--CoA ligase [Desulfomonile tiedjei]